MSQITVLALSVVELSELNKNNVYEKCGWWDWWCSDHSLIRRSKPMISIAKRLDSKWKDVGLFLKNNNPVNGSTYDSMALQDSNGDNVWWIDNVDGWTVYDVRHKNKCVFAGNLIDAVKFLNDQEVPK